MNFHNSTTSAIEESPGLIGVVIGNSLIATVGILGNLLIVVATLSSNDLQNKCNYLIAVLAVADMFSETSFTQSVVSFFTEFSSNVSVRTCFYQKLFSTAWILYGSSMTLVVGVDRVLAMKLPLKRDFLRESTLLNGEL